MAGQGTTFIPEGQTCITEQSRAEQKNTTKTGGGEDMTWRDGVHIALSDVVR